MANDELVLLRGGTLIDGTGTAPLPTTDLLFLGDRILGVGAEAAHAAATETARGAVLREVDVSGRTVMPGLIDAHCHITFGEPSSNDELFFHRQSSTAMLLAAFNVPSLGATSRAGIWTASTLASLRALEWPLA